MSALPPNPSLHDINEYFIAVIGHLRDLVEKDTLSLSEFELELHDEMIDYIRSSMRKNK